VELDAPTGYLLRTRDAARVYVLKDSSKSRVSRTWDRHGGKHHTPPAGARVLNDEEYDTPGTTAYEVHASRAIDVDRAYNCWLFNVRSLFRPQTPPPTLTCFPTVSSWTRRFRMTIERCELGRRSIAAAAGNGYLFHIQGNDTLLVDLRSTNARHGFIFNQATSGNVFLRGTLVTSRLTDDSHRFLSHANLYDGVTLESAWLSAVNRGSTAPAEVSQQRATSSGIPSSQKHSSARSCAVETAQWAYGYAIGTRAATGHRPKSAPPRSPTATGHPGSGLPVDFVEGEGQAQAFSPVALCLPACPRCAVQASSCTP